MTETEKAVLWSAYLHDHCVNPFEMTKDDYNEFLRGINEAKENEATDDRLFID